ncbi:MAG: ATP-binding protein [Candidatus Pacebacteria bacterium]|nr:ATP-binding protein [Candidatus Paceibacterota bacterium]
MARPRANVLYFLKNELRLRSLLLYAITFLSYFGTATFGEYLFYYQHTSPALIWPPFGIAIAAILIGGYRMWLPIALAQLFASYSIGSPLSAVLTATLGQTVQAFVAVWVMQRFKFDGNLSRIFDAFILIATAVAVSTIAPTFLLFAGVLEHGLTSQLDITWVRTWAGSMFSILLITPLITVWLPPRELKLSPFQLFEMGIALALLCADVWILAWSPFVQEYGLTGIYALLAILVWIALRMEPRILTLALLMLAIIGMGGAFFANPTSTPLNQTLFTQELFIEFIAIIYLVVSALAEERRRARYALERNVEQLRLALEKIESEDIAKNQFIATLAHELRNPLAPVVSALDLLSLQDPSPDAAQTIEGAQRELNVMRRLLDDILDVARVSQPRFKLQVETTDARALLERCIESTKNFLRNRRHTLIVSLPEDSVIVRVDPIRFEQIVVNLLNNAGKYTAPSGRIELECKKDGSFACITVRDNGVGIPMESLEEVFEPFRQIRPTAQIGSGLGIGLWLTKRLVEMHGGRIEAKSEGRERGSSFSIYLPLEEGPIVQSGTSRVSTAVLPPFKILVVDDNEAAARALQKLLRLKGNDVRMAHDGKSGIATARDFGPKVILLDIGLPDMSGYDVAKELRRRGSDAVLIALTGFGQEEDKEDAKKAGFDYHLTKPVGIADIEAILGRISRP